MKILAWSASFTIAVLSVLPAGAHAADRSADAGAGKTKAGVCAACHGADGNSTNPIWPKLAGQNAKYLEQQVHAIKSQERDNPAAATMRPLVAGLSDDDIRDIAAYYAEQAGTAESAAPGQVELGQRLYRGGDADAAIPACMSCHGPAGHGNSLAGYPKVSGQHAVYTAEQLRAYRSGTRATDQNEMMRTVAKRLSDAQIEALASYISGLH
jgi:cbb3-type cytochrome c oxidase subunit III